MYIHVCETFHFLNQEGEDKVSYERHLKVLQGEFAKTRSNPAIAVELMRKTFPLRRVELTEEPHSLPTILQRFPFLQEVDHVSKAWRITNLIAFIIFFQNV